VTNNKFRLISGCAPTLFLNFSNQEFVAVEHLLDFGDGWTQLVCKLLQEIEKEAELSGLNRNDEHWPRVTRIKEKMGGLRVSLENSNEAMEKRLREAYEQSLHICDICGHPGSLRKGRQLQTRCDAHADKSRHSS